MTHQYRLMILFWLFGGLISCASQSPKESSNPTITATTVRAEDQAAWQNTQQYLKQKKWAEAKIQLLNLQKTNPQATSVIINLTAVACELEQWQEANNYIKQLPAGFASGVVFNLQGLLAQHNGQIVQAEQHYLAALAQPNPPAQAQYNLALLYDIYWQDPIKALPFYEAYAKARPDDKSVNDWISEIKLKAKR
jgi:Tfp pilus assembly protein PilF